MRGQPSQVREQVDASRRTGQLTVLSFDLRAEVRHGWDRILHSAGGRARRRVILVLASVLGLSTADSATVGASATQLRHALHVSNTDIGILLAITSGIGALATVPLGAYVDRTRRVRLLGTGVALWGVAMAISAAAPSFVFLCVSRVGLGLTLAVSGPAVASLLGDYFSPQERSRIYGMVLTGELFGAGAGFVLSAGLATWSWRASFACLALPSFVLGWFVMRLPEPARGGMGHLRPGADSFADTVAEEWAEPDLHISFGQAVRYVLSVRTNVVLIISGACSYFFFAGVRSFGVEFATAQYQVSHGAAAMLTVLLGLGAVVGVLVGGRLGDRYQDRRHPGGRMIVGGFALALASILFVPGLVATSSLVAVPILIAASASLGAVNPPLDAARLAIMPAHLWGRAEGVRSVLQQGAQAMAPVLFGFVADSVAGGGQKGLQAAFFIMLIPLMAAGAILFAGRRTYSGDVADLRRRTGLYARTPCPSPSRTS